MSSQSVIVHLPEALFSRVKMSAEHNHRTVEQEVVEMVAAETRLLNPVDDIDVQLRSMQTLDVAALTDASHCKLDDTKRRTIEALHEKRRLRGLTPSEIHTLSKLMSEYEHAVMIRSKALEVMHGRGVNWHTGPSAG